MKMPALPEPVCRKSRNPSMPSRSTTTDIVAALVPLIDAREAEMLRAIDTLSLQERAVFVLLGRGLRPKAIGFELAISVKTVETHLARVRAKFAGEGRPPDLVDLSFLARLWVRASRPPEVGGRVGDFPT